MRKSGDVAAGMLPEKLTPELAKNMGVTRRKSRGHSTPSSRDNGFRLNVLDEHQKKFSKSSFKTDLEAIAEERKADFRLIWKRIIPILSVSNEELNGTKVSVYLSIFKSSE